MNDAAVSAGRWPVRFGALLFVATGVAGGWVGYRAGLEGCYVEHPFVATYQVGDLVVQNEDPLTISDYDSLIRTITSMIDDTGWQDVGGSGTITANPADRTLVVSQTRTTHQRIGRFLQQLREASADSDQ